MDYLKNTSYIFIPFNFSDPADFKRLIDEFDKSILLKKTNDKILYMLKYVSDKINSNDKESCQCFHYEVTDYARNELNLATKDDWFTTKEIVEDGKSKQREEEYRFKILSIQLYCFSTTVGIFAFKIYFEKNDPFWISNAQYYLKKVSRENICLDFKDAPCTTMLEISKSITKKFSHITEMNYFYYANPTTERANLLTYIEVAPQESYKKELYYLKRCYSDGYLYVENEKLDEEQTYIPSNDTVWGISSEAAVCLACPDMGRGKFLRSTFYENFNAQYLFMYVLLLHQKYVLYMFLTKIGIGTYNNLETLETYRHQLYEFETDFVFSCITEVPQYQNLYDRMAQAFSLKKMYEDVHEPLVSLGEIRRETAENEQKKRDDNVNKALLMLSVLSFFSALVDSFDFVQSFFGWFLGGIGIKVIQICCILGITVTVAFVFKNLFKSKRSSSKNHKQ